MREHRSFFFPMALIAVGVLWLLVNFGYLPSANLWALTYLWPFLLIGLGVSLLLRSYWADAGIFVSAALVIGAVAAVIYAPQLGWAQAPKWQTFHLEIVGAVAGSRNIETETRSLGSFSAIDLEYPAEVTIRQGDAESVSITTDDNLLPQLRTDVSSGILRIYNGERNWNQRVNASKSVHIEITVRELNSLRYDSAGSVIVAGLQGDALEIRLDGAGSIVLEDIQVSDLELRLNGAGSLEISGTTDHLTVQLDGLGSVDAGGLTAQTARVAVHGLGSATLRVIETLDVEIDGLGSVSYFGSPTVRQQTDGLGSVKQLED